MSEEQKIGKRVIYKWLMAILNLKNKKLVLEKKTDGLMHRLTSNLPMQLVQISL